MKIKEINPLYQKALVFSELGEVDSSFKYFNKAKDLFLLKRDSLGVGKCLANMAYIAINKKDYFGGIEISLSAISYFDSTKKIQYPFICFNFGNLGNASYQLKEYTRALKFYDLAIKFYDTPLNKFRCLNNKAKIFEEIKKYNEAIKIYDHILKKASNYPLQYAAALGNISFTKWLQNPNYNPIPELLESLSIRERENNQEGLNYCYARLSDYYAEIKPDLALVYAHKMYQISLKNASPYDQLEALYKLVKLSPSKESKNYFVIYEKLDDSLQTDRNSAKNQFALIRYETEKHKADNLVLQKDIVESKYQIIKQKALLVLIFVLAIAAGVIGFILYKKRKQKIELSAQNAIRKNQLKTSKKVHDVVANGLYRVMVEIENNENLNRNDVLDKLEDMYEKSRDLSYEEVNYNDQNFQEKLAGLLKSFATETTKIAIVGNTEELWKKISANIKYEVEHILQELMVNMKKHSHASNVAIKFEQKSDKVAIYYADNGVGIPPEQQFKNGLTNTGNRIISIDGEIIFDTKAEKGLKIQISFPIS